MTEYFFAARGSSKSSTTYIARIKYLYEKGKITHEDYLRMTSAALIKLL